jgi:hypothetical protein
MAGNRAGLGCGLWVRALGAGLGVFGHGHAAAWLAAWRNALHFAPACS